MTHKALLFLMGFGLASHVSLAQNKLYKSLGNFQKMERDGQTITISTTNGVAKATIYSPTIARIRAAQDGKFDDFTYAVVGNPQNTKFDVREDAGQLTISTDSMSLVISKSPVRFKLLNKKGQVINEDEPSFGTGWLGEEVTTYKKLMPDEKFIGLGEKTGDLNRRGQAYTNFNNDYFGYPSGADPIYQTQPFYMGIHSGLIYGLFMDNSYKSHFNFGGSNDRFSSFTAEDGEMNYYLIANSSPRKIIESYTYLTGRTPMPPYWALGLQQSRYSYYPDKEVKRIAETYREKGIPADAMVLDIHYMDAYKIWSWDKRRFPEPQKLISELKDMGFNTVVIIDPGIKVEKGYHAYESGLAKDVFAKYPDGKPFVAAVWPGWCHFPDFTKPSARDWWGENFKDLIGTGVRGFWNDMNEPACWGNRFPDLVEFDFEGKKGTHRRAHNLYGLQMSKATYEGTKKILKERPFNLTRAGYSGIQRYAAVWTGDNRSEEDHMMVGVRLLNSMGLTGIPFVGTDVGGFTGGASKELFGRWVSIGAFNPFFRIHSAIETRESDPWSYGEKVEAVCKNYIKLRYKLLPTLYSSFYESSQNGLPIMRSLALDYALDNRIYNWQYQHQFFFGNSLMICPVESNKELVKVLLPEASGWYDFYNDAYYKGNEEIIASAPLERLPIFVKGGGILAIQSDVLHTGQKPTDTLSIHLYNGANGSSYVHYEDDGRTFEHENGGYFKRTFTHNPAKRTLEISAVEGSFSSKWKAIKVVLHGYKNVRASGVKSEQLSFVEPMPSFDPLGYGAGAPSVQVSSMVIVPTKGATTVKW